MAMLAACTPWPPPDCETPCGMQAWGAADCAGLAEAEAAGVSALGYLYGQLCARLGGMALRVWRTSDGWWTDAWGRRVAGLTWCDFATIEVGDSRWTDNAYWHELAHVAQCPEQDGTHETWAPLGIWEVLNSLRASGLPQNEAHQGGESHVLSLGPQP